MKVKVTKPFAYAYQGHQVMHYREGVQELPKECAEVALVEKWAVKMPVQKKRKRTEKGTS